MSAYERYGDWSRNQLLRRIAQLEATTAAAGVAAPAPEPGTEKERNVDEASTAEEKPRKKAPRPFNVSEQPCRKIALRFCYDGSRYSGLAAQPSQFTPLPTVEELLWDALCTARLVDPAKGMDGAGWSRCGRTDAGVSAAGQVVALWVRSRRVDERPLRNNEEPHTALPVAEGEELPYVATLNRLLPPTIRVQAWSPVRADFSARFDCVYRHYKYFFTEGAVHALRWPPESASHFAPQLDLGRMREAAARLVGEHDFSNLCKVDASKQITSFLRRVDGATIDRVERGWPVTGDSAPPTHEEEPMYVLNLRGTAFLYHQVRHIMAVLLLVGAGLEEPAVVTQLTDVRPDAVFATKPSYEMAADRPLVLWECGFRDEDVHWRASAYDGALPPPAGAAGADDYTPALRTVSQLHAFWTRERIHTELARHFVLASTPTYGKLPASTSYAEACTPQLPPPPAETPAAPRRAELVPLGNGATRPTTKYQALHARPRDLSLIHI